MFVGFVENFQRNSSHFTLIVLKSFQWLVSLIIKKYVIMTEVARAQKVSKNDKQ